jgi:hypothetical protein
MASIALVLWSIQPLLTAQVMTAMQHDCSVVLRLEFV